jgi:hypothetical protein
VVQIGDKRGEQMTDYISAGVPCMFNNFKCNYELEAKIRHLLKDALSVAMTNDRYIAEVMEVLSDNHIEDVVVNCAGCVYFWYIGGQSGS